MSDSRDSLGSEKGLVSTSAVWNQFSSWHRRLQKGETKWPTRGLASLPSSSLTRFPGPLCSRFQEELEPRRIPAMTGPPPQLCSRNVFSSLFQASLSGSLQIPIINVPFTLLNSLQKFNNHGKCRQGILSRESHSSQLHPDQPSSPVQELLQLPMGRGSQQVFLKRLFPQEDRKENITFEHLVTHIKGNNSFNLHLHCTGIRCGPVTPSSA